jgi:poly-gamma-glutamate synthesis protein (capsule biosynthesis protein)
MPKIFVCGDITNSFLDGCFIGEALSSEIRKADYAVCNFEGPELKVGQNVTCPHQKNGTAAYLKQVGFDLMLLANNHITELGADGVRYSIETITKAGADCIGAGLSYDDTYRPVVRKIRGMSFGFINICEAQVGQYITSDQQYGYAWMGYGDLFDDVRKLSKETDCVIVFVHSGLEHYPIPLPEIRDLYRKLVDCGASVVVGGHPHCPQGWERYGKTAIIYSLGNFFFPLKHRWPQEDHSYSVMLEFEKDGFVDLKPIFHSNNGLQVEIDNDKIDIEALNEMLDKDYSKRVDNMINLAYNKLCKRLILDATCGQNEEDNLKSVLQKTYYHTIRRKQNVLSTQVQRESSLLLLFENETYRWVITRYLNKKLRR